NSRIESFLSRSVKDRTQMVVSEQGKWAITNYTVIEEFPLLSYVKLKLETGRTHQIRVHMSSIGHPVVGDQIYGGRRKQTVNLNQQAQQLAKQILEMMPRQALHAKTLGFTHPINQQKMIFNSELPSDMQSLIDFLSQATLAGSDNR
ncbi:MAG: pseudouridine synthase, partial [bacterium]|nr:pseudouridine synthase [bacterium]